MTDEARTPTRLVLRPLANPMPLGMVGLAAATVLLAGQQLGWLPTAQGHQVGEMLMVIAVPMQLLAAVAGFAARDAVLATGMGMLAAIWFTVGIIKAFSLPGSRSQALGLFLFLMGTALLIPAVTAGLGKLLTAGVFVLTAVRLIVTGVYEYQGGTTWMTVAGWLGVALCVVALYAALAFEVEDMRRRTVLPTLRRGAARHAMSDAAPDVDALHREAGVRNQL